MEIIITESQYKFVKLNLQFRRRYKEILKKFNNNLEVYIPCGYTYEDGIYDFFNDVKGSTIESVVGSLFGVYDGESYDELHETLSDMLFYTEFKSVEKYYNDWINQYCPEKNIKLTESDLTNIVKRVIKESKLKNSLIDMIKESDWETTSKLVGGVDNLKKLSGIESPMEFLNLFNDLDVVQSKEEPNRTLYRYKKENNMMIYNKENNSVYIDYNKIWSFLEKGFGLYYPEIQEVMKEWLGEVYNLRGVTPGGTTWIEGN